MREQFEEIYADNIWGCGSGEGSLPKYTRNYVAFLERFLRDNRIRTVADLGCGDWKFSRFIDWGDVEYHGYDVVRPVLAENQRRFRAPNVHFHLVDGEPSEIADADLLIAKDVMQHWSNERVHTFLPHLARFGCALITNCATNRNVNIHDGDFRPLDLRQSPFGIEARPVHEFFVGPRRLLPWRPKRRRLKRVLLVRTR